MEFNIIKLVLKNTLKDFKTNLTNKSFLMQNPLHLQSMTFFKQSIQLNLSVCIYILKFLIVQHAISSNNSLWQKINQFDLLEYSFTNQRYIVFNAYSFYTSRYENFPIKFFKGGITELSRPGFSKNLSLSVKLGFKNTELG